MTISILANSALVPSAGNGLSWQKDGHCITNNESCIKVVTPFKFNFMQVCISLHFITMSIFIMMERIPRLLWNKEAILILDQTCVKWVLSNSKSPNQAPRMFCSHITESCLVSDLRSTLLSWSRINNIQTIPYSCLFNPFLKSLVTDIPQPPRTMRSHVMTKFLLPFIKWLILDQMRSALGRLIWNNSQTDILSIV